MAKMKNTSLIKPVLLVAMVCTFFDAFGQLEFMHTERWLFLGSGEIEGKKIIAGVYVLPKDASHLRLEIDIADDWVTKDSLREEVALDRKSVRKDKYFISDGGRQYPAYRFVNQSGLEIRIAKEKFHESYDAYGVCSRHWNLSYAQVYLPTKRRSYVRTLPLMYEK